MTVISVFVVADVDNFLRPDTARPFGAHATLAAEGAQPLHLLLEVLVLVPRTHGRSVREGEWGVTVYVRVVYHT